MLLNNEKDLNSIIVNPLWTKNSIKISRQLKTFQKEKQHMAFVKSKTGKIVGLITMEDILEELVGEIDDEYDEERDIIEDRLDEIKVVEDNVDKNNDQSV